ncbi:MAG: multinuclear nonheme iron-dependent oxidase, partial [Alphaproteobacteria bacterium]
MPDTHQNTQNIPARAGVGYKPVHLDGILAEPDAIGWLEVHAENYMGDGGPQIGQL